MESAEEALGRLERLAKAGKWKRFFANPARYFWAQWYRRVLYPRRGATAYEVPVFWGGEMEVMLPASTDIYLLGGKTHPSEIRLARYLWRRLSAGDTFVDVGAHYGYFSLLAAERVGRDGRVISFEAAPNTYEILARNALSKGQIQAFSVALAESEGEVTFYEFPNLYGEYNSLNRSQYEGESWYVGQEPKAVRVPARPLDAFVEEYNFSPDLIKIDVEGAEEQVVRGADGTLRAESPAVVMEYLINRGSNGHPRAVDQLLKMGYTSYLLSEEGKPEKVADIEAGMRKMNRVSDNVLFTK